MFRVTMPSPRGHSAIPPSVKKILPAIPILSILPLEIQPLLAADLHSCHVSCLAWREREKKKKMRALRIISREQILPVARAQLFFLKAASSIRIKPPAGSRKTGGTQISQTISETLCSPLPRRPGGGHVPFRYFLPPSLPRSLGLAVNETLPGSVSPPRTSFSPPLPPPTSPHTCASPF